MQQVRKLLPLPERCLANLEKEKQPLPCSLLASSPSASTIFCSLRSKQLVDSTRTCSMSHSGSMLVQLYHLCALMTSDYVWCCFSGTPKPIIIPLTLFSSGATVNATHFNVTYGNATLTNPKVAGRKLLVNSDPLPTFNIINKQCRLFCR